MQERVSRGRVVQLARYPAGAVDPSHFEVVEVADQVDAVVRQVKFGVDPLGIVVSDMVGELFWLYFAGALKGDGPLDGMFELADISVPGIVFEDVDGLWRDR